MKLTIIIANVALSAVATLFVACTRESKSSMEQASSVVAFAGAGLSLNIGEGWTRIEVSPGPPTVCPPTLVSEHGTVQVMLFAPNRSDIQKAARSLRAALATNAEGVEDSFLQEEFATESGLRGVRLSYTQRSQTNGRVTETRSHSYIVTNRKNRCVSINYVATAANDSETVHEMIRKSLRLQ